MGCSASQLRNALRGGFENAPPCGLRRFARETRGAAVVEAAIAITFATMFFAALMQVVSTAYTTDRLERAARAAARAVALLPSAPASDAALRTVACNAIRNELSLPATETCSEDWTFTVEAYEDPAALRAGTARGAGTAVGGDDGDIVAVRISWTPPVFGWLAAAAASGDDDGGGADSGDNDDGDGGGGDADSGDGGADADAENGGGADPDADAPGGGANDNANADPADSSSAPDAGDDDGDDDGGDDAAGASLVAVGIARNERI